VKCCANRRIVTMECRLQTWRQVTATERSCHSWLHYVAVAPCVALIHEFKSSVVIAGVAVIQSFIVDNAYIPPCMRNSLRIVELPDNNFRPSGEYSMPPTSRLTSWLSMLSSLVCCVLVLPLDQDNPIVHLVSIDCCFRIDIGRD
jgi:hypothetical protein